MTTGTTQKFIDRGHKAEGVLPEKRGKILLVTSSLLVDRVFLYTDVVSSLSRSYDVVVWAASFDNHRARSMWGSCPADVEPLPAVRPFREMPYNYLRRLNEFAWDYRMRIPSRMSMMKHVRDKRLDLKVRSMKLPARLVAACRAERIFENRLERLLLSFPRSPEAEARLRELRPSAVVITGPFQFEQPAIMAAAKKLGIPVLAYIPSWDNVSTKNRMVFKYDGYVVWTEGIKKELHEVYPATRRKPVYVVGAAQFDIFDREEFLQTREDFCREQGLDPNIPIIVYAIGSPNFLKEHHGAIDLARRIESGELGQVQMLVRPHPIHDKAQLKEMFRRFGRFAKVQETADAGTSLVARSQDESQIREWINTFRHADVVVNLSSTVTVDAAIFDKPIVNLDFDPQPGQADQELIRDVNHKWNHFKPVAESEGIWLVNDFDELANAVKTYLRDPSLHRAKRKWLAEYVCGWIDGKCGLRMSEAIGDFTARSGLAEDAMPGLGSRLDVRLGTR